MITVTVKAYPIDHPFSHNTPEATACCTFERRFKKREVFEREIEKLRSRHPFRSCGYTFVPVPESITISE